MPKIQKQVSRKVGDKSYYKYVVSIPREVLEKSGIKDGDEVIIDSVEEKGGVRKITFKKDKRRTDSNSKSKKVLQLNVSDK